MCYILCKLFFESKFDICVTDKGKLDYPGLFGVPFFVSYFLACVSFISLFFIPARFLKPCIIAILTILTASLVFFLYL
jgi:hypothetical protein